MMKPLIVITPQRMPMEAPFDQGYQYSNTYNTRAILEAGGLPVIPACLTRTDAVFLMERADGLLMSGGADVCPERYGQQKLEACGQTQPERDASDLALLEAALQLHRPVLCICRGCQLANVYFGGTLYQDLPTQFDSRLSHSATEQFSGAVHRVELLPGSPLEALFGAASLQVNSLHHQAIRDLAPGLERMALAPDGLVESWYLPGETDWVRAYQWHPEMLADAGQRMKIFEDFLTACQTRSAGPGRG